MSVYRFGEIFIMNLFTNTQVNWQKICLCLVSISVLGFSCSKKSDYGDKQKDRFQESRPTKTSLKDQSTLSSSSTVTDTLAQRVMQDYGLVVLNSTQTANIQFNTYTNYNDAAAFINSIKSQLQNGFYTPSMGISV